jgi:hypothetical protein
VETYNSKDTPLPVSATVTATKTTTRHSDVWRPY